MLRKQRKAAFSNIRIKRLRPDSHRTFTLMLPITLKYCLMHYYQSIHTVWARSTHTHTLTINSNDILRGAMSVSGRCESHFLLSHAQIIAKSVIRVSVSGRCENTSYFVERERTVRIRPWRAGLSDAEGTHRCRSGGAGSPAGRSILWGP